MNKKIIGTSLLILTGISANNNQLVNASEEESFSKEELIYTVLDQNWNPEGSYITNLFEGEGNREITDYGSYDSLRLIGSEEEFHYENNIAQINTDENRVITQGELTETELPWSFTVRYYLDGNQIQPTEYLGEKGNLSIELDIEATDDTNDQLMDFYNHYVLQVSTSLDRETHFNLESEEGIIATVGNNRQIQWTVLPGTETTLTFNVTTEELEDLDWTINAAPFQVGVEDDLFDISNFIEELEGLENGISDVNEGSNELYEGTQELSEGVNNISDGTDSLVSGTNELNQGSNELYLGVNDLISGGNTLSQALSSLHSGTEELSSSTQVLSQGSNEIYEGTSELSLGLNEFNDGLEEFIQGLDEIEQGAAQLNEESPSLVEGSENVLTALESIHKELEPIQSDISEAEQIVSASQEILNGIEQINTGISEMDATITQYYATLADNGINPTELAQTNATIQENIMSVENQLLEYLNPLIEEGLIDEERINELLSPIHQASTLFYANEQYIYGSDQLINGIHSQVAIEGELRTGLEELYSNYRQFHQVIVEIVEGLEEVEESFIILESAINTLANEYSVLHDGLTDYTGGVADLLSGLNQLTTVSESLQRATNELNNGSTELMHGSLDMMDGINQFSYGVNELNAGTREIYQGGQEVNAGILDLQSGVNELRGGSQSLYLGSEALRGGIIELEDGVYDLSSGSRELAEGTDELREETLDLPSQVEGEIESAIDEFTNQDYELSSFIDERNEVDNVQFIIQYRGEEIESEEENIEEEDDRSFWQRIRDLFPF